MRQEVSQSHPDKTINVEFMKLDLSSFKSTKDFTVAFKDKHLPLHILVNNAGLFHVPFSKQFGHKATQVVICLSSSFIELLC